MSWERRGARSYFYRVERRDGKLVKSYVGKGAVGEIAARLVANSRRRRVEQAATLAAERALLAVPDAASVAFDSACELMVAATLTAAGFPRSSHQPWRRRRERTEAVDLADAAWRG